MNDPSISAYLLFNNSAWYRIRVFGRLTADWSERLQGMLIIPIEDEGYGAATELSGVLADQAALMGVLTHLYDCGIALISMKVEGVVSTDC